MVKAFPVHDMHNHRYFAMDKLHDSKIIKQFLVILENNQTKCLLNICSKDRHLYELIPPEVERCLYFDIEWYGNNDSGSAMKKLLNVWNDFSAFVSQYQSNITIPFNDLSVYTSTRFDESSSQWKNSFHITCDRYRFSNLEKMRHLLKHFKRYCIHVGGDTLKVIDWAVYTSWRAWRLPGQSKMGLDGSSGGVPFTKCSEHDADFIALPKARDDAIDLSDIVAHLPQLKTWPRILPSDNAMANARKKRKVSGATMNCSAALAGFSESTSATPSRITSLVITSIQDALKSLDADDLRNNNHGEYINCLVDLVRNRDIYGISKDDILAWMNRSDADVAEMEYERAIVSEFEKAKHPGQMFVKYLKRVVTFLNDQYFQYLYTPSKEEKSLYTTCNAGCTMVADDLVDKICRTSSCTMILTGEMGSGKTRAMMLSCKRLMERQPNAKILWLVGRVSLTNETFDRFRKIHKMNVWHYRDSNTFPPPRGVYIYCVNSLSSLCDHLDKFDVLIVDEFTTTINNLNPTMICNTKSLSSLRSKFTDVVHTAKRVIFSESLLMKECLEVIEQLLLNRQLEIIELFRPGYSAILTKICRLLPPLCIRNETNLSLLNKKNTFTDKLVSMVLENKTILIGSNRKKELEIIRKKLYLTQLEHSDSQKDVNGSSCCRRATVMTGDTEPTIILSEAAYDSYHLFINTKYATGHEIDVPFDAVFIIFVPTSDGCGGSLHEIIQVMGRCRNITSKTGYVCITSPSYSSHQGNHGYNDENKSDDNVNHKPFQTYIEKVRSRERKLINSNICWYGMQSLLKAAFSKQVIFEEFPSVTLPKNVTLYTQKMYNNSQQRLKSMMQDPECSMLLNDKKTKLLEDLSRIPVEFLVKVASKHKVRLIALKNRETSNSQTTYMLI